MTNKTVVRIRVWVRAWIRIYMRTRNYYIEMNDIWLENKLKVYVNQSKICIRFTDID